MEWEYQSFQRENNSGTIMEVLEDTPIARFLYECRPTQWKFKSPFGRLFHIIIFLPAVISLTIAISLAFIIDTIFYVFMYRGLYAHIIKPLINYILHGNPDGKQNKLKK